MARGGRHHNYPLNAGTAALPSTTGFAASAAARKASRLLVVGLQQIDQRGNA